jgi:hypothetical protein
VAAGVSAVAGAPRYRHRQLGLAKAKAALVKVHRLPCGSNSLFQFALLADHEPINLLDDKRFKRVDVLLLQILEAVHTFNAFL